MGKKVSPRSYRLQIHKDWESKWFNKANYVSNLHVDLSIRKIIFQRMGRLAAVERVIIERTPKEITVNIYSAKPGIIIGRSGQGVTELKNWLEKELKIEKGKLKINITEVKIPELSAKIMAQNIALQLEKRIPFRRVLRYALDKIKQAGAKGVRITVAGRLDGADIARTEKFNSGSIPLSSLKADVSFAQEDALTTYGIIGIKVWIYKGESKEEE